MMRILTFLLLLILSISKNYAQKPINSTITKADLVNFIEQAKEEGKVNEDLIIVLDEQRVVDIDSIKANEKFFAEISIIRKGNKEMNQIYGDKAENGIIMIQSPLRTPEGDRIEIDEQKVIYLLGKKEIEKNDLQKIHPDKVEKIEVIKSREKIAKITDKECDGIVIIHLKKQE